MAFLLDDVVDAPAVHGDVLGGHVEPEVDDVALEEGVGADPPVAEAVHGGVAAGLEETQMGEWKSFSVWGHTT